MLIYVRIVGAGPMSTLQVNVNANDDIQELLSFIKTNHPMLQVKRVLFAGKELKVDLPFSHYDVHKECTIQVLCSKITAAEMEDSLAKLKMPRTQLSRQVTAEEIRYGDVLIVTVLEAEDLAAADYWSGKSDPYCILSVGDGSQRGSVISKNLNPKWNETFGFYLSPLDCDLEETKSLSIMVWDHDYLSPDELLGTVDIPLSDIPRYIPGQTHSEAVQAFADARWYNLSKQGRVKLLIRRAGLSSPSLRDVLARLQKKGRPWTKKRLRKYKVSLEHLLGEDPWVMGGEDDALKASRGGLSLNLHVNPAVVHLEQLLRGRRFAVQNPRTVAKVGNILWSQRAVHTQDLPNRYLWLCDVALPPSTLWTLLQEVSSGQLKSLITFPNIPPGRLEDGAVEEKNDEEYVCAVATFKSCNSAVLVLIELQNRVLSVGDGDDQLRDSFLVVEHKGDESRRDSVMTQPSIEESRSISTSVNVDVVNPGDSATMDVNPVLLGFADSVLYHPEKQTFDHAFSDSVRVGILSLAGPYPMSPNFEHLSNKSGQSHQLSEWGKHLVVLSNQGILRGFLRLQDYPDPGPAFTIDISSKACLVLVCGPWSVELVDTEKQIAYYVKCHSEEILNEWKTLFKYAKRGTLQAAYPKQPETTMMCPACEEMQPLAFFYLLDTEDGVATQPRCRPCLEKDIMISMEMLEDSQSQGDHVSELLNKYSLQDLKDLGSSSAFEAFLDRCTDEFLKTQSDKKLISCPKCEFRFEVEFHTWATKKPNLTKALGLDNQPLNPEAQRHFLANRFRCRNHPKCNATFCRLCGKSPYHIGFTCEEYVEYLTSPHCRFCTMAVMRRNKWRQPTSEAFKNVCNREPCIELAKQSCTKVLSCGHPCGGAVNELECLPCLDPECVELRKQTQTVEASTTEEKKEVLAPANITNTKDDLCSICFVDELGAKPAVLLECGHVFHLSCVRERLGRRWNGHRIQFKYCQCPLCNQWMKHTLIEEDMISHKKLYNKVVEKIAERLELDEDEDEKYISRVKTDTTSIYYNKPLEWAMHSYAYYICKECEQPYFGGKRDCEDAAADEKTNPDELICFDCATVMSSSNCNKSGHKEYILYKCRFCCSPAVWFCFGTTHFCEYCHSHWPPNRHPENEKCPGKDGKCPLGLKVGSHKNGADADCEYAIGCGMCRNELRKNVEEQHAKELEDRKRLRQKRRARLGLPPEDEDVAVEKVINGEDDAKDLDGVVPPAPPLDAKHCTYKDTGSKFTQQDFYTCRTCSTEPGIGVCKVCKDTCHKDHDVVFYGKVDCYCDCGSNSLPGFVCSCMEDRPVRVIPVNAPKPNAAKNLGDILAGIRKARYGRLKNNHAVMIPFGQQHKIDEVKVLEFDENGLPVGHTAEALDFDDKGVPVPPPPPMLEIELPPPPDSDAGDIPPPPPLPEDAVPQLAGKERKAWQCKACTYMNRPMWLACDVCNTPRDDNEASALLPIDILL